MYFTLGMPNPWDETLRRRAVRAYDAGEGEYDELAGLFGIGVRTLQRWVHAYRAEGTLTPKPKGGGWRSPILLPLLHALVAEAPDATCAELCWAYNRRAPTAHQTTFTSLWRALRRAGYVLKKNGRGRVNSTGPTSSRSAPPIGAGAAGSMPAGWCSSTKPARTSRWAGRTRGSRKARSTSRRVR